MGLCGCGTAPIPKPLHQLALCAGKQLRPFAVASVAFSRAAGHVVRECKLLPDSTRVPQYFEVQ